MFKGIKRRAFCATLAGFAAGSALLRAKTAAAAPQSSAAQPGPDVELTPKTWDTSWMTDLKGTHKVVFDLLWHTLRPNSLNPARNYLDVQKQLFGLEFPSVNVVLGMNSTSFAINASDALWAKWKLGERYKILDPDTARPATRNVYLGSMTATRPDTVLGLQASGAIFMMCNKSMNGLASEFSQEFGRPRSDVYVELTAGLNPGVKVVPALSWALSSLQEHGFTYAKL